jgi:quinol monooxygenase YgiN
VDYNPQRVGLLKEVYMHGMNVRVKIQPGKVEKAAKLLREEVMPSAANYRGFIQNFLIVDAPNSRLASLSVWESETDAKAIYEDEGGLYQAAIAKLKPMLEGPPDAWMGPLTRVDK